MGKGNRNDRQRVENQSANEERFLQKKKNQQNKTRSDKAIAAACIVIALVVVAILVINVFNETGVFMRIQPVMTQEDVLVDQAMMTYFVNDYISGWYSEYANYVNENYYYFLLGYMSYISLDLSKDLDSQKITDKDVNSYLGDSSYVGRTWYDYFSDQIISTVEMYVTYANAANDKEITLSAADHAEIDEIIDNLKSSLRKQGVSISDVYGKGVSESDIRKCYELIYLASAFGEYAGDEVELYLNSEKGQAEVKAYPDKHKEDYYFAKVLSYSISLSEKKFKTQEEYDKAVEAAKEAASKIAEAKNPNEFLEFVEEYLKNPVETGSPKETTTTTETKKETETEAKKETSTETKEETETTDPLDKYTNTIYYETKDELGNWLFNESESAGKNDVTVIEVTGSETETESKKPSTTESESKGSSKAAETESDSETETGSSTSTSTKIYKTFKTTVYMVLRPSDLDRVNTHNFGYVITNDKAAAEKILSDFKAVDEADRSRDKFKEMAEAYYNKHFADHEHTDEEHVEPVFVYDAVRQGKAGYFASAYGSDFKKFDTWLDSSDRGKDGEKGEIMPEYVELTVGTGDNKQTYYAVIYFERHHSQAWMVDAYADITQDYINDWYEGEIKKDLIDFNESAFDDIMIVKYS